jgi:GDP-L-fucose synthase
MFADDLGAACVFLMEHYDERDIINVGTGEEITILDLAKLIADVVKFKGSLAFDSTKPDGTPRKLMDSSRLHSLGFHHQTTLKEGLRVAYQDFLKKVSAHATRVA